MTQRADSLLQAWDETVARRASDAAVFDTSGAVLRTFAQIGAEAAEYARMQLANSAPGEVVAIQLGNHAAWLALLLACLRRRLVVLPLERTIAEQERATALAVCHVALLATEAPAAGGISLAVRSAEPVDWGEHQPVLLKLTSGTTAAPRA
ncbi:MAG: AMP-binding protein, partial [Verrucomicrobiota bacterium]|nr:AMP-binding protein [Verrucomicrobiota bacterium]